jgi:hypothetical protein
MLQALKQNVQAESWMSILGVALAPKRTLHLRYAHLSAAGVAD